MSTCTNASPELQAIWDERRKTRKEKLVPVSATLAERWRKYRSALDAVAALHTVTETFPLNPGHAYALPGAETEVSLLLAPAPLNTAHDFVQQNCELWHRLTHWVSG